MRIKLFQRIRERIREIIIKKGRMKIIEKIREKIRVIIIKRERVRIRMREIYR